MQQFKVAPDKLSTFKRILIRRTIIMMLIMGCFCLLAGSFIFKEDMAAGDLNPLFIFVPLMIVLLGVSMNKNVKKLRKTAETYTLTITEEIISREQAGLPTLFIKRNEIRKISRTSTGNLLVTGPGMLLYIEIPSQIDNYTELYEILNSIKPVKQVSYNEGLLVAVITILSGLATLGIFAGPNKVIIAICGTVISVIMCFFIYLILSGKYGDEKTKKKVWIYMIAAISYIIITINKLLE
ncbi:hypothetical protein [Chitinophaga filiformis]|uniref:PH domain-containing protein n=1 Tax=Chitinophaga filiformis TaxID=104663 RepID=A0ABY4IAA4_CHIFI|nr:hypothetical protein [Chitinophaga filiformis]UPK72279.1 hypothetical protein MYF79_13375 [Chitinophaga filiformis]